MRQENFEQENNYYHKCQRPCEKWTFWTFLNLSYQPSAYVGKELTGQRWKKKVFRCIKNTLRKVDWLFFKTDTENLRRNFSSGSHFQKISAHGGREGTGGSWTTVVETWKRELLAGIGNTGSLTFKSPPCRSTSSSDAPPLKVVEPA